MIRGSNTFPVASIFISIPSNLTMDHNIVAEDIKITPKAGKLCSSLVISFFKNYKLKENYIYSFIF